MMIQTWAAILAVMRSRDTAQASPEFRRALGGTEALAALIAEGPLASELFGWTSMFDLCIQQTETAPYSGPYLRVSPLVSGVVEFRYVDTAKTERQWRRQEKPAAVIARFEIFICQLGWASSSPPQGTCSDHGSNV